MKSWENNRTTKQGKQIISPQTNCPLEHSAHRTAYTTNLPESLDSLQQKERKILLLSQIMFIEHIFPFSESVFYFLNNLWLRCYWFLRKRFLIFFFRKCFWTSQHSSAALLPNNPQMSNGATRRLLFHSKQEIKNVFHLKLVIQQATHIPPPSNPSKAYPSSQAQTSLSLSFYIFIFISNPTGNTYPPSLESLQGIWQGFS